VWFFLTPVVYPPPQEGLARSLIWANPVAVAISATREALLCQSITAPGLAAIVAAASLLVLLVAWVLFRVAMPHVIARSSA
jgi:lipopolysaccharide transport system permease protein